MPITQPREFLRAFVDAVVEAANEQGIAYGVERDGMLLELVSIFVQELQATTDEQVFQALARKIGPSA